MSKNAQQRTNIYTSTYGDDYASYNSEYHIHDYLMCSLLPEVQGRGVVSPLTSHVTVGGYTVVVHVLSYHKVRDGATTG